MSAEQNKAIISRWVASGWNTGDLSMVDEFYAADYTLHSPSAPNLQGLDAFKGYVTMFRTAFPDLHFTIEDMVAEKDKVAWRATTRGTHGGELMGIPPTGNTFRCPVIAMFFFEADRISCERIYFDTLTIMSQLGIATSPVTGA
jgi:steroid delta-isomerase-like uncharacterized protein